MKTNNSSNWLIYRIWGKLVGVDEDEDEDRLTNLPEEISTHILSFLPIKDAIRTSLLSTKWTHLWKTLPDLHFDYRSFSPSRIEDFLSFAKRATLASNSILRTYKLTYSQPVSKATHPSHVLLNSCISTALSRKVRKLEINYIGVTDQVDSFFSSLYDGINTDSLTELNLRSVNVRDCVRLSSLKILRLYKITLSNGFTVNNDSSELNLSFPVLEVLSLYRCKCEGAKVVNVVAPMLNSFSMHDEDSNCEIKVHGATSITRFEYTGYSMSGFDLGVLSSVVHATIDLYVHGNHDKKLEIALLTCTFLRQLSSLKFLTLSSYIIAALARVEDLQGRLYTYNNLIHLTISAAKPLRIVETLITFMRVETLITLLQSWPVESLFFTSEVPLFKHDSVFQEAEFSCSLPHLKVVKFEAFNCKTCELKLAKLLSKNAKNLEIMTTIDGSDLHYCSNTEIDIIKEQEQVKKNTAEHTKSTQEVTKQKKSNGSEDVKHFGVQFFIGINCCLLFSFLMLSSSD